MATKPSKPKPKPRKARPEPDTPKPEPDTPKPVGFALRMPPDLDQALKDEAKRQDRSQNNLIVRLLKESLERTTDPDQATTRRRR